MGQTLRLHALSILPEDSGPALEATCRFYSPFEIEVELLSQEHLLGFPPELPIFMMDPARLTPDQLRLYARREPWPLAEVAAFFVGSLPPMRCHGFSHPGLNISVVASGAPPLTLAHELGHLLGLGHVQDDPANLMFFRGPQGPEARLDASQLLQVRSSPLLATIC